MLMKEDKERYTLALFTFNKGITEIPEELVDETHPIQYKPFDNFGLAWYYLSGASSMAHGTAKPYSRPDQRPTSCCMRSICTNETVP